MAKQQSPYAHDVRIGPMSVFTLIVVICLAVLAVLAFSTANATFTIAQRQAQATTELYLDETAAQQFVAGLADELASGSGGAGTMQSSLSKLSEAAEDSTGGQVAVTANMDGNQVRAEFSCDNGRTLAIVVTIRDDGTYRIDKWKMTAVQNEEEPAGKLWTGN